MGTPMNSQAVFGVGIYSYADAARFIGGDSKALRRWLLGYGARNANGIREHRPLWTPQLAETGIDGIGFRDLVELRFVRTFIDAGVPFNLIRRTVEELRERLGREYPFTSTTFKTDGKRIFMELLSEAEGPALVDVVRRQNVIAKVIGPSLREGVELNIEDEATRWYPVHGSKEIVFDPDRSFGQPILAKYGIPTVALAEAVTAEAGDAKRVARLFEVPLAAVRQAVKFESRVVH